MKALQLVLNQIETNNELERTMKDILESNISDYKTVKEIKNYMVYEAICVNGSVGGLIYYSETNEIFKNNFTEIFEMLEEYKENDGTLELEFNANTMVWFTFETMIINWVNGIDWDSLEESEEA